MVSYCDHCMSVVGCAFIVSSVINNCFKGHLLNYWLDFDLGCYNIPKAYCDILLNVASILL